MAYVLSSRAAGVAELKDYNTWAEVTTHDAVILSDIVKLSVTVG